MFVGAAGAAIAPGCGDQLPPQLGAGGIFSDGGGTGNPDSAPDFGFDGAPKPKKCDLGPDAGVCTCIDVPLLYDVPNIYFVLDRSGSMEEKNKWKTAEAVVANTVLKLGPRINYGMAAFPDPVQNSCFAGRQVMPVMRGDAPAGTTTGPTYQTLLATFHGLSPGGGTPTAATLDALLPTVQALQGRTYVILATDGGPNCDPQQSCDVDQCIMNIERASPECVPNAQPNCCDLAHYGPLNCIDAAPTIAAVAAYASANIPVYVIGVYGSGAYAALLDKLAQAGNTARATSPYYYRVDGTDEASLQQALAKIAAKIVASCTIVLSGPPDDPGKVNVFFDGVVVPQAGPDGWTLQGSTVTLEGAACDKVLSGDVLDVNVSGGCPTVLR